MNKRIIAFVHDNRFLYDKQHPDYRNLQLKAKKWTEFSHETKMTVPALKQKWKCIRDRYYRVQKNPIKTGTYKYYNSLLFLDGIETYNLSKTEDFSASPIAAELCDHSSQQSDVETSSLRETEFMVVPDNVCERSWDMKHSTTSRASSISDNPFITTRKSQYADEDVQIQMLNVLKNMQTSAQPTTPFRKFLESLALTVENANFSLHQIVRLQMNILNMVQEELDKTA